LTNARPPAFHTHPIAQVIDLQVELDGKVSKAGDTMSGHLVLNADPTAAMHAATKQYVDNKRVHINDLLGATGSNQIDNGEMQQYWDWTFANAMHPGGLILRTNSGGQDIGTFSQQFGTYGQWNFSTWWDPNAAYSYDVILAQTKFQYNTFTTVAGPGDLYISRLAWNYGKPDPSNNPNGLPDPANGTVIPANSFYIYDSTGTNSTTSVVLVDDSAAMFVSPTARFDYTFIPGAADGVTLGGSIGAVIGLEYGSASKGTIFDMDLSNSTFNISGNSVPFEAVYPFELGVTYNVTFTITDLPFRNTLNDTVSHVTVTIQSIINNTAGTSAQLLSSYPVTGCLNMSGDQYCSYPGIRLTDVNGSGPIATRLFIANDLDMERDGRVAVLRAVSDSAAAHAFAAGPSNNPTIVAYGSGRARLGGGSALAMGPGQGVSGEFGVFTNASQDITTIVDAGCVYAVGYEHTVTLDPIANTTANSGQSFGGTALLRGGPASYAGVFTGVYPQDSAIAADGATITLGGGSSVDLPGWNSFGVNLVGGTTTIRGGSIRPKNDNGIGGHVIIEGGTGTDGNTTNAGKVILRSGNQYYAAMGSTVGATDPAFQTHRSSIVMSSDKIELNVPNNINSTRSIVSLTNSGFEFGTNGDTGHAGAAGQALLHDGNYMYWGNITGGGGGAVLQTFNLGTPYIPA
jgi:hypothetical protein